MQAIGISTPSHYVPLHASPGGARYGRFAGVDRFTTRESERLVRLPVWFNMTDIEAGIVIDATIQTARAEA
jgi:dTDP-4-amino-4,6-dideoxygalactose transaminase